MLVRDRVHSVLVHTPAKLNLFLEVLGKRADGYHELETLMVSVALYDSLIFTEEDSGDVRLRCFSAGSRNTGSDQADRVPHGTENLVVRAAQLLQEHADVRRGVCIDLWKRIPAAAGLGGGSSDAAATLAALNRLWRLELSAAELCRLAARLGSDVPFFLADTNAAFCRGRGEEISPCETATSLNFVVVQPLAGLSTAAVYRAWTPAERSPNDAAAMADSLREGRPARTAACLYNALQAPAEQLSTEVRQLAAKFSRQPVLGHMLSGSGTACFGLCAHRRQALRIASRLRSQRAGRVFVARTRP